MTIWHDGRAGLERENNSVPLLGPTQGSFPAVSHTLFIYPAHTDSVALGKSTTDIKFIGDDLPPAELEAYPSYFLFLAAFSENFLQE